MKVYLVEYIHKDAYDYLSKHVEIVDSLEAADGVISRNLKINSEFMDKAPNLKVIGVHGTGVDDVDLAEAKRRGILVYNAPKQNAMSVAELNVALMLAISRRFSKAIKSIDTLASKELSGFELNNKTVGFIGLGDIAIKTAKILKYGFDMNIIAYTKSTKNIEYIQEVVLDQVLANSDYVVIGMSLNNETKGFINKELLLKMKNTAYLINTARGAIVNQGDLLEALKNKTIAGYAADVFENEPLSVNDPLLNQNVVALPHVGANTDEALKRVGMLTAKNMIKALNNEEVGHIVK